MKYELWIHGGLRMREKILSGLKFQFRTMVFLSIRKILRLKEMVLAKNLTNLFAIFLWQCLEMQWTQ